MNQKWQHECEAWMIREGLLPSSGAQTAEEKATLASLRTLVHGAQAQAKQEERDNTLAWLKSQTKQRWREFGLFACDSIRKLVAGLDGGAQDNAKHFCSACGGDGGFGMPPGACEPCDACKGTGRRGEQQRLREQGRRS